MPPTKFLFHKLTSGQIEERRKEIERTKQEFFAEARDGFFISSREGEFLDCNGALVRMLGYSSAKELLDLDLYTELWVVPEDRRKFQDVIENQSFVKDYNAIWKRKDGQVVYVSLSANVWKDREDKIQGYRGLVVDQTEIRRLRNQLIRSERVAATGKMATQLANELSNPISGIINCLGLLKEVVPETHEKRKYLDLAYAESERTAELLKKMLEFLKPDDEQKYSIDMNKLIEETLLFYKREFQDLNIRVTTDFSPALPHVMAVEGHLKQVFINLITNANAAMPTGGELRLATRYDIERNNVVVTIEDTGVGIPPQNLDRIFEAFFSTKEEVKGVGLGLTICYGLIREHGGRIDVASEVGKGTVFTIQLPLLSFSDTTGSIVNMRRATIEDFPALAAMYDAFDPEAKDQGLPPSDPEIRRKWVRYMLETGENVLAWQRDKVVAHACLFFNMQQGDAEYLIFVRRPWQHLGIGTRLTDLALRRARDLTVKTLWLSVESSNFEAIRLYRKFGFGFSDDGRSERTMTLTL